MDKTSQWLLSFNSQIEAQIKPLLAEKKNNDKTLTLAITAGKGGVGKTSMAIKFAKTLGQMGLKTLLIDCDFNLSNTAIKLGLPIQDTFYDLLSAKKEFDECLYKEGDFHLLSACNGNLDLFDSNFRFEQIIVDIMNTHADKYDFILLDCPAGLNRETLTLAAYCDDRIFVVTPDRSSITDSYSLIKILGKNFGIKKNHLLINMYSSPSQFGRVATGLSETVENYVGSRTYILGGVQRFDGDTQLFDQHFLQGEESDMHRNFLKVLNKYTDYLASGDFFMSRSTHQESQSLQQDVLQY